MGLLTRQILGAEPHNASKNETIVKIMTHNPPLTLRSPPLTGT
jgi:hypothetical protein